MTRQIPERVESGSSQDRNLLPASDAGRIALGYLFFGGLWLIVSDTLLGLIVSDPSRLSHLQTYKGFVFVALTGLLLYIVLRRTFSAQTKAEAALTLLESRCSRLIGSNIIGVMALDESGAILDANDAFLRLVNYSKDDLLSGRIRWQDLVASTASDRALDLSSLLKTETTQPFEIRFRKQDGQSIPALLGLSRLPEEKGRSVAFVVDLTEQKVIENELREAQARLNLALHIARLGSWTLDIQTKHVQWSDSTFEIYGTTRGKFAETQAAFLELVHPEDRARTRAAVDNALRNREPLELEHRIVCADGTLKHVHERGEVISDQAGNPVRLFGTTLDITDRRLAEEAIRRSEEFSRAVFSSLSAAVCVLNANGEIVAVNEVWKKLAAADYGPPFVTATPGGDYFALCAAAPIRVAEALQGSRRVLEGKLAHFEMEYDHRRDRENNWFFLTVTPLFGGGGGVVISHENITPLKRTEEQLRLSEQRLRALARRLVKLREEERQHLSREVHDELGQMLTALKMDIRWAEKKLAGDLQSPSALSLLDRLRSATQLIDSTISTVQKIASDLRPGTLDKLGLLPAIREEVRKFNERSGVPCRLAISGLPDTFDPETVTGIYRVLQETLTNITRHAEATEVLVSLDRDRDNFILMVSDNGRGMRFDDLTNPRSLGLIGMQERALVMGGSLRVYNRPGGGTVVELNVPVIVPITG